MIKSFTEQTKNKLHVFYSYEVIGQELEHFGHTWLIAICTLEIVVEK